MNFKKYLILIIIFTLSMLACEEKPVQPRDEEDPEDFQISTRKITADGRDLYYSILVPNDYSADQSIPLVLALHYGITATRGVGKNFITSFIYPSLKDYRAVIAAPVCPVNNGWGNSVCDKLVTTMIDTIKARYNIDSSKVIVTGYSMGAEGTWYFAVKHPEIFRAAIPVSGAPSNNAYPITSIIPSYIIHSDADEVFPLRQIQQLLSSLAPTESDITLKIVQGAKHYNTYEFVAPLSEAVSWIEKTLGR